MLATNIGNVGTQPPAELKLWKHGWRGKKCFFVDNIEIFRFHWLLGQGTFDLEGQRHSSGAARWDFE